MPTKLCEPCDWLSKFYPISLAEVIAAKDAAACLQTIPQSWDYTNQRHLGRLHQPDANRRTGAPVLCRPQQPLSGAL